MGRDTLTRWASRGLVLAWEASHVPGHRLRTTLDPTPPDGLRAGSGDPVVLLPGIFEPWRYLLPLARALHRAGHPVVTVPGLGLNRHPLEESVSLAAAAVLDAGVRGAVLVGHSKGGLIGKALLLDPVVGPRLRGLVALCTPWTGSPRARGALRRTPLGVFASGNPDLARLARAEAVNARITSLEPRWDEFVPAGPAPAGARSIALDVAGHFRPVIDPRVHAVVVAEVGRLGRGGEGEGDS